MNITGLAMSMSNIEVGNQVGTAVLSKAMDTNEALGAGLVEMIDSAAMEQSVNPHLGTNIDLYI